jgi:DNA polymerase elongation subunit (family B)
MRLFTLDWTDQSAHTEDGVCGDTCIMMYGICESGKKHSRRISGFDFRFWVMLREEGDVDNLKGMVNDVSVVADNSHMSVEIERYSGKKQLFARIASRCAGCLRKAYNILRTSRWDSSHDDIQTFEGTMSPVSRFLQVLDISPHAWIRVPMDHAITCWDIFTTDDFMLPREICCAAFDIECLSDDCVSFPDADKENDCVEQVGLVLTYPFSPKEDVRYIFTLQHIDTDPSTEQVIQCSSELEIWKQLKSVVDESVHVLTSYNGFGFDFPYLIRRCCIREGIFRKTFSTAAFGCQSFTYVEFDGVLQVDMLVYLRKEKKLESYKLDSVANLFLGSSKLDVTPHEIFKSLKDGSSSDRRRIAEYCLQDCALVTQLMARFQVIRSYIAMCNVTSCPFMKLVVTGQQARTLDMLSRTLLKQRLLMPDKRSAAAPNEAYTGATVLEAHSGLYTDPVAGLDFASLYPSIMIANNLCISTRHYGKPVNPEEYHLVDETYYKKEPKGVIPQVLQFLWTTRKETRAKMKHTTDKDTLDTLNAQQLSYKLVMNSLYGTLGSSFFPIESQSIAKGVTWFGRKLLHMTQDLITAKYGDRCEIVYGDSVTGDTLVQTEHGPFAIADLAGRFTRYMHIDKTQQILGRLHGKQTAPPSHDIRVGTLSGMQPLQFLIRRRFRGKIYVIRLSDGTTLRITGDHAILHGGRWTSARELRAGMAL